MLNAENKKEIVFTLEKFYKLHPKFDELRVTKKRQTNFLM
jgi:hypothetical protein